jgi:hypothetical protein
MTIQATERELAARVRGAAATQVYDGPRAAKGVIRITTKP